MSTELLETQQPAGGPIHRPPVEPPRPFACSTAGCLRRLSGLIAVPLLRLDWRIVGVVLLALASIPVWHALSVHAKPQAAPASGAHVLAVAVGRVTRQDLNNEVIITAEFRPYAEVELHAKVSGFLRELKVDFGDQVKAGQLLATLEVPELQDELHNAIATEQKAEADYTNAHLIYMRLATVNKEHPNLVAQQELDTAETKDRTTAAAIAAAKADVAKYHTLADYTRITAPFDGVITKRYADPGALIQAGTTSETQSLPLVRISDNYRLRLDFPVSVTYVKDAHVGDPVEVRVESLGGKSFTGIITRTTERVEEQTRTMTTEIEVPNPSLTLVPGMYATVALKVERRPNALAIPTEAVFAGQKSNVYVVNQQNRVEERPVTLGLETPSTYEVLTGLKEGELVLIGSRSQVKPGQTVEPKLIGSLAQQ
jgi:RND family efflux transporter MFP subunit